MEGVSGQRALEGGGEPGGAGSILARIPTFSPPPSGPKLWVPASVDRFGGAQEKGAKAMTCRVLVVLSVFAVSSLSHRPSSPRL